MSEKNSKRPRQWNSTLPIPEKRLQRSSSRSSGTKTGMMRRKSVKPRNAKRRASEFARCYGSKERVAFVKALPCVYCVNLLPVLLFAPHAPSHNAHTVTGGKGRKADADTIVPLCANHHRMYDEHRGMLGEPRVRDFLKAKAADIEALWQRECERRSQGGDSR